MEPIPDTQLERALEDAGVPRVRVEIRGEELVLRLPGHDGLTLSSRLVKMLEYQPWEGE